MLLPVDCLTTWLAVEVTAVCITEAVENPDVAGPTNANGAIKHPDNAKSINSIIDTFFNDSPLKPKLYSYLKLA